MERGENRPRTPSAPSPPEIFCSIKNLGALRAFSWLLLALFALWRLSPSSSRFRGALEDRGDALADADAERRDTALLAARAHRVKQRAGDAAPLEPIGWPSAIAPPLTFTRAGRARARAGTRSTARRRPRSARRGRRRQRRVPARASASCTAGIGPSPMKFGSTPAVAYATTRASGASLGVERAPPPTTSKSPAAPSLIGELLPAVTRAAFPEHGLQLRERFDRRVGAHATRPWRRSRARLSSAGPSPARSRRRTRLPSARRPRARATRARRRPAPRA